MAHLRRPTISTGATPSAPPPRNHHHRLHTFASHLRYATGMPVDPVESFLGIRLKSENKASIRASVVCWLPFRWTPSVAMETEKKPRLAALLKVLPPVEFCCVYGSALHPNNSDKSSMVDYILGVANPLQWHTENMKINKDHYASWMAHLGGAKLITEVADEIGVGAHFNPFVIWKDKMFKYGVVRMDDLIRDVLNWERFYFSGRLQKPVCILVDNLDIGNINSVNLRAAISAALLLSPSKFSEENLYAKICSLSYVGDLRMFFAEDKNKVNKIVKGQFTLFQSMYKPFIEEFATKDLLRFTSSASNEVNISQDCGLSAASTLVSRLPPTIRSEMASKFLRDKTHPSESGELLIGSREKAADCMRKIVMRRVMVSSSRQVVSGVLTVGAVHGVRYLGNKMLKAWKSWA